MSCCDNRWRWKWWWQTVTTGTLICSRPEKIIYFSNHTSAHLTHASQNKVLLHTISRSQNYRCTYCDLRFLQTSVSLGSSYIVWGILCLLRTDAFCDPWRLSDISRSVEDQISDVAVSKCILFSSSPISMILILIKMKAIQTISIIILHFILHQMFHNIRVERELNCC